MVNGYLQGSTTIFQPRHLLCWQIWAHGSAHGARGNKKPLHMCRSSQKTPMLPHPFEEPAASDVSKSAEELSKSSRPKATRTSGGVATNGSAGFLHMGLTCRNDRSNWSKPSLMPKLQPLSVENIGKDPLSTQSFQWQVGKMTLAKENPGLQQMCTQNPPNQKRLFSSKTPECATILNGPWFWVVFCLAIQATRPIRRLESEVLGSVQPLERHQPEGPTRFPIAKETREPRNREMGEPCQGLGSGGSSLDHGKVGKVWYKNTGVGPTIWQVPRPFRAQGSDRPEG